MRRRNPIHLVSEVVSGSAPQYLTTRWVARQSGLDTRVCRQREPPVLRRPMPTTSLAKFRLSPTNSSRRRFLSTPLGIPPQGGMRFLYFGNGIHVLVLANRSLSNNVHLLQDSGAEGTAHVEKAIYG